MASALDLFTDDTDFTNLGIPAWPADINNWPTAQIYDASYNASGQSPPPSAGRRVDIIASGARLGTRCVKIELRQDDGKYSIAADAGVRDYNQLMRFAGGPKRGEEFWSIFSLKFDLLNFPVNAGGWWILWERHHPGSAPGTPQSDALGAYNGKGRFKITGNQSTLLSGQRAMEFWFDETGLVATTDAPPGDGGSADPAPGRGSLRTGIWYDFVVGMLVHEDPAIGWVEILWAIPDVNSGNLRQLVAKTFCSTWAVSNPAGSALDERLMQYRGRAEADTTIVYVDEWHTRLTRADALAISPAAGAPPPPVGSLPTSFTGADESPLSEGGAWSGPIRSGDPQLRRLGNTAKSVGPLVGNSYFNVTQPGPDCEAVITMTTLPEAGNGICVVARIQNPGNAVTGADYRACYHTGVGFRIFKRTAGSTFAQIGPTNAAAAAPGDRLKIQCVGSTIKCFHYTGGAWVERVSADDGTISASGYPGLWLDDTTAVADDFDAYTFAIPGPTAIPARYLRKRHLWEAGSLRRLFARAR